MIAIELDNGKKPTFLPQFAALSKLQDVDVNAICCELGVEPISSFLDQHKFDSDRGEDDSSWYSAKDGAKSFSALTKYVLEDLDDLKDLDPERLERELNDACELLNDADHANTSFHLIIVIMMPGTEEFVGR